MMIEYPPQTFLSSRDSPWKCLLVGKRIESCSQKQALTCMLSNNVIAQTPNKLQTLTGWFM